MGIYALSLLLCMKMLKKEKEETSIKIYLLNHN